MNEVPTAKIYFSFKWVKDQLEFFISRDLDEAARCGTYLNDISARCCMNLVFCTRINKNKSLGRFSAGAFIIKFSDFRDYIPES
jgi:hypothetical protein